jgi:hypothetical protein
MGMEHKVADRSRPLAPGAADQADATSNNNNRSSSGMADPFMQVFVDFNTVYCIVIKMTAELTCELPLSIFDHFMEANVDGP